MGATCKFISVVFGPAVFGSMDGFNDYPDRMYHVVKEDSCSSAMPFGKPSAILISAMGPIGAVSAWDERTPTKGI